jgi:hypothetical protein
MEEQCLARNGLFTALAATKAFEARTVQPAAVFRHVNRTGVKSREVYHPRGYMRR